MNWFDILKEPLISVPKSIVSMKKPKKVETKEDCKERLKAFIEKVKSMVPSQHVIEVGNNTLDGIPEEVACKVIELLRKEANNKSYVDGGVTYRGKFPEVRERQGNLPRLEDVGEWEISVLFAKFDVRTMYEKRSISAGTLYIEFYESLYQREERSRDYKISVHFDMKTPEEDNYDKVKAAIP